MAGSPAGTRQSDEDLLELEDAARVSLVERLAERRGVR
jgi:hypothetical protein